MFKLFEKMQNGETYIIAEMSANHAGKLENALEIVRQAAKAGADCVKIQTYTADTITIDCDNEYFQIHGGLWDGYKLYDLYTDAGTPWEWQERIKAECEACGVDFLSTPFDATAVDFLEGIGCEAYKIASFELVDIPLIKYAASKGKPMIISCGMGSEEEIQDAVDACFEVGNRQVVLLKCCSEYPAKWEDMHLANIPDMTERFGVPVGLSDHSMGSLGAVVGVSLGACVVEKHICLSRAIKNPDSAFSMEIGEFADMVRDVRAACAIRGRVSYGPNPGEQDNLKFRRSLFAVKDMKAGEIFTEETIRSIRPSAGLQPRYYEEILGQKAARDIAYGEPIRPDLVEGMRLDKMCIQSAGPSVSQSRQPGVRTETSRLVLREIESADAENIVAWRSDPEVYRFFGIPHAVTLQEHLTWYNTSYLKNDRRLEFMAIEKETGEPVGVFGIRQLGEGERQEKAEVGYLLKPQAQGKGYASEAVLQLIQMAKEKWAVKKIVAEVYEDNEASLALVKRLQFVKTEKKGCFFVFEKEVS